MGTKLDGYIQTSARSDSKDARRRRAVFAEAYSVAGQLMGLRIKRELTQAELAGLTGIAQSEISRIERGVVRPTDTTLVRLADAMSADVRIVERRPPLKRKPTGKRQLTRV